MRRFLAILLVLLFVPIWGNAESFDHQVFANFDQAKQNDNGKAVYIAYYVEMIQTMYDALYKTGQVGTDSFWAAVDALVPHTVYSSRATGNAQVQAIYEYFNSFLLVSVTLQNDICSYEYSNIEYFVKKGISCGIFRGNIENFSLNRSMTIIQMCNALNVTETSLYVSFIALDMYNTDYLESSFVSQVFGQE